MVSLPNHERTRDLQRPQREQTQSAKIVTAMQEAFEERIRQLTQPINGQLPRPWMTKMTDPLEADVFIVGMNQRNGYPADQIPHERHLDALFNRNGESCRGLYDEATNGKPSLTRPNTDGLTGRLNKRDVHNVVETNVVCFSTPLGKDLRKSENAEGARKGEDLFCYLLDAIAPPILIVHGAGSLKRISRILKMRNLKVPRSAEEICDIQTGDQLIIPIPSLAPPGFNMWSSWSSGFLDAVADRVRDKLAYQ